ncbi:Polyketide synthase modules and related proteins [hydrothermal vent metagenome]|uniref:Polyketide synthase modules and related proteins n=1 Tax=hydrothermal vent metagenome TaxID=652676 RepID=A0A3B0ZY87_9ZZZZ
MPTNNKTPQSNTEQNTNPLMKNALLEIRRMRNKLANEQREKNEPIAIVGSGCRFSGGVESAEDFFKLLKNATDTVSEIPASRWDVEKYYDPDPNAEGKMYTRHGSFLDNVDKFDAAFFGISGREAETLDPQQRLLLEVAWETLENAGIVPEAIPGGRAGIYIAGMNVDYAQLTNESGSLDVHTSSGTMVAVAAGRLAHVLGLHGPSMIVDTACSSSLVAVHLACHSLRRRECDVALAGGMNLMLTPHAMLIECATRMLAPDGRCKTFDTAADGFGRGEGGGMVALKRLSDAIASGDNIIALIRGSAVNHDGHSSGLSVPNGLAQEEVIREALKNAQVEPDDISYVEAHGTGTNLGDPIEIGALHGVFGRGRKPEQPLLVGSVKTNLGHLEWSAGITGLLKTAVSLYYNQIPPHINYSKPNPHIAWDELNMQVVTNNQTWPGNKSRMAGVSSFGFSGTNSHMIMEQAPEQEREFIAPRSAELLVLSAKTEAALKAQITRYRNYFQAHPDLCFDDICYTASVARSHFDYRISIPATDINQLIEKLAVLETGAIASDAYQLQCSENKTTKRAFLCTGQGSQYAGMGKQLYDAEPVFREVLERCNNVFEKEWSESLLDIIFNTSNTDKLNQTCYTQPAIYALEVALAAFWHSWGVKPDILLGHSVGEYAAAHLAGVFTLEDGLILIARRARLMQALPAGGEMLAVMATAEKVQVLLNDNKDDIALAVINGPDSVVISGAGKRVQELNNKLKVQGIRTQQLNVSHAFHSPLMKDMLEDFKKAASSIQYQKPHTPIISNVSGQLAGEEIASAKYWVEHVLAPVEFNKSMLSLAAEGVTELLELGPKPILIGLAQACINMDSRHCFASLNSAQDDRLSMLTSLGELYVQGATINWSALYQERGCRKAVLPTYAFQRKRYWVSNTSNGKVITKKIKPLPENSQVVNYLQQGKVGELAQLMASCTGMDSTGSSMLPELSKALIEQHQCDCKMELLQDWLYNIEWRELTRKISEENTKDPVSGYWLVLSGSKTNSKMGLMLAQRIRQQGQACIVVATSDNYHRSEQGEWKINPEVEIQFKQLLLDSSQQFDTPLLGIIHAWPSDQITTDTLHLDGAQAVGAVSLVNLIKALDKNAIIPRYGVWSITRGIFPVQGESSSLSITHATISGLAQSIALEHPELWGGIIDLSFYSETEKSIDVDADNILKHAYHSRDEIRIAFRNKKQYVPRLVRKSCTVCPGYSLDSQATYLISGGTGGLGLQIADWLIGKGARHLVLLARSKASKEVSQFIKKSENIDIKIHQVDVSDNNALSRIVSRIMDGPYPLRGVIHAAGCLADASIRNIDNEKIYKVMKPKVQGSWNLHSLTKDIPLDFFVMFSSAASVFGAAGQANYAAANSYVDALAHYRHSKGLVASSINWGSWANTGMAARLDEKDYARLSMTGVADIDVESGLAILGNIIALQSNISEQEQSATHNTLEIPQLAVLPVNWEILGKLFRQAPGLPFLSEIPEFTDRDTSDNSILQQADSNIIKQMLSADDEKRISLISDYLKMRVAEILKVDTIMLADKTDLFDIGIDSLMVMELLEKIKTDLQLMLYPREIYANPVIKPLAEYVSAEFINMHNVKNKNPLNSDSQQELKITQLRTPKEGFPQGFKPLDNMIFLLSTPRAGSTLLRAMLAGHSALFSPPELHLLTFASMTQRHAALNESYLDEGLQRALMVLMNEDAEKVQEVLADLIERDAPVTEVYALLQSLAGSRTLVDKSPTYGLDMCILERAEAMFNQAKYIHLVRHPISSIESFARMRMDKLLAPQSKDPYSVAEKVWRTGNNNIKNFLQKLPDERVCRVRFEDLVSKPKSVIKKLSDFLELDFDPEVLKPYAENRMTDGIHQNSLSIGDPNFLEHEKIEADKANAWKKIELPSSLLKSTQSLASQFNYQTTMPVTNTPRCDVDVADVPMSEKFINARGMKYCLCEWGDNKAPIILLLHGILDQGAAWEQVAVGLARAGYYVIAPDLRGHGKSEHLSPGASYNLMDFIADIESIIESIQAKSESQKTKKLTLVGHSMGTILASMYAAVHPENINALILVETVLPANNGNALDINGVKTQLKYLSSPPRHKKLSNVNDASSQLKLMTPGLSSKFAQRLATRITHLVNDELYWMWDPILSTRAGIAGGVGLDKAAYLKILGQVSVPTTLIFGESSTFIRAADRAELTLNMSNAKYYTVDGGHQIHIESSSDVTRYILQAVESNKELETA